MFAFITRALFKFARFIHEHVFDVVRVIDEQGTEIEKSQLGNVAVVARYFRKKASGSRRRSPNKNANVLPRGREEKNFSELRSSFDAMGSAARSKEQNFDAGYRQTRS